MASPHPTDDVDPYAKYRWLDSLEGLPSVADAIDAAEQPGERGHWAAWRRGGHARFAALAAGLPGVALAAGLALASGSLADFAGTALLGYPDSPISSISLAILLGLALRNTLGLPAPYEAGLQFCARRVLRFGVALLGFRLSLGAAGAIGIQAVPVVIACIASALALATLLARALQLPRALGVLIAMGTAICGNTAVVATGSVIGAKEDEVSYAVGCVTLFGLVGMLAYPFLAHALFAAQPELAGMFLGTAIHDTAQVAGAGLLYAQQYQAPAALDSATVTKLVRNLFLVVLIPAFALRHGGIRNAKQVSLRALVPGFVLGFAALCALRTLGDLGARPFGLLAPESWQGLERALSSCANLCLAVSMAAIGLGTSLVRLRVLGLRPLAAGFATASCVGVVSYAMLVALGAPR